MKNNSTYIPALRWNVLTPFYDSVLRYVMQEDRFKNELIRQVQILPGQQVLDLGCGTATLTVMLKQAYPEATVTGLDGDPAVLRIGRTKADSAGVVLTLDQGMAFELPYPDKSFDLLVSSLMFHHLSTQNKQRTMKEAFRVIRPGGSFWIVDFGPPQGVWSRLISPFMAHLEEVSELHKGLLLSMMHLAGLKEAMTRALFATLFGTLYLYTGRKAVVD